MADKVAEAIETIIDINSTAPRPDDDKEFNPALLKSNFQLIADNYNNNLATFVNNLNATPNKVSCSSPAFWLYLTMPNNLKDIDPNDLPDGFQFTYPQAIQTNKVNSAKISVKLKGKPGEYTFELITADDVKNAVKRLLQKATEGDSNPTADKYMIIVANGEIEFKITNLFKASIGSRPYLYDDLPACKIVPCVPDPQPFVDAFANPGE